MGSCTWWCHAPWSCFMCSWWTSWSLVQVEGKLVSLPRFCFTESMCECGVYETNIFLPVSKQLDDTLRNGDILPYQVYSGCLRMDGQTLVNLEIFSNNADGGTSGESLLFIFLENTYVHLSILYCKFGNAHMLCLTWVPGTLYKYLDNCVTSSGRRLLRNWICHPLKDVPEINNRLNVVEALMVTTEAMSLIAQCLRKLPDLERLLGQVKASVQSSVSLLLPFFGKKILKQRVCLLYQ